MVMMITNKASTLLYQYIHPLDLTKHTRLLIFTFLSLPVLFLFAHAAGMSGLLMEVFGLWQPQAHSGMRVPETQGGKVRNLKKI